MNYANEANSLNIKLIDTYIFCTTIIIEILCSYPYWKSWKKRTLEWKKRQQTIILLYASVYNITRSALITLVYWHITSTLYFLFLPLLVHKLSNCSSCFLIWPWLGRQINYFSRKILYSFCHMSSSSLYVCWCDAHFPSKSFKIETDRALSDLKLKVIHSNNCIDSTNVHVVNINCWILKDTVTPAPNCRLTYLTKHKFTYSKTWKLIRMTKKLTRKNVKDSQVD